MNKNTALLCLVTLCSIRVYCTPYYVNEQKAQRKEKVLSLEESEKHQFAWNIALVQICHRVK